MGLFDLLKNKNNQHDLEKYIEEQRANFDVEAYKNFVDSKIKEFNDKYDLSTADGIRKIPISEATNIMM